MCFLEVIEAGDAELRDTSFGLLGNVEVTEHESREIEVGQVVEHLSRIERVGGEGQDAEEGYVAVWREGLALSCRVDDGLCVGGAPCPERPHVEAAGVECAAAFQAFDDEACHLAHVAFGILLYEVAQFGRDFFGVGRAYAAQRVD